jgi:hypothetical protein
LLLLADSMDGQPRKFLVELSPEYPLIKILIKLPEK